MKIIYIAGYGRSGSTLADVILSNRSGTFGLGEIANLPRRSPSSDYLPIWNNCIAYLNTQFNAAVLKNSSKCDYSFNRCNSTNYKKLWLALFNYIQHNHNEKIDAFVDSSKTTWKTLLRPKRLQQSGFDIYIIHLKRNRKNVFASTLQGNNRTLKKRSNAKKNYAFGIKSVISRALINLLTKFLYKRPGYNYKIMHYEKLIEDPALFIREVYGFCGINYLNDKSYIERIKFNSYYPGTAFEGNRMRTENNCIAIKTG
jgi:hypothetical protein